MTHHIVFLDRSTQRANVRRPALEHTWQAQAVTAAEEPPERLRAATIAITNKVPLRGEVLQRLPALKMIAVAATGHDVVDVAYCVAHGIAVANIRNYAVHGQSVARAAPAQLHSHRPPPLPGPAMAPCSISLTS